VFSLALLSAIFSRLVIPAVLKGQAAGTATARRAPLSVEDVLSVREFADREQLDVSPDGKLVAYALIDPRRAAELTQTDHSGLFSPSGVPLGHRGADVVVADTRSGATRNLTNAHGSSWGPVWAPSGRWLAFYSDRDGAARLWLWDRKRDVLRRVSKALVHTFFGFEQVRWSPDGRRILVKLMPAGLTLTAARRLAGDSVSGRHALPARGALTARVFTTSQDATRTQGPALQSIDTVPSFFNASLADLALADVATGRERRIVRRVRPMAYRFSPDGARIAYTTRQPDDGKGSITWGSYDLSVVDTSGRDGRLLMPRIQQDYGLSFSWSPDGRQVGYTSGGGVEAIGLAPGRQPRRATRPGLQFDEPFRAPLWLDDSTVIIAAADTLWRVSLGAGTIAALASIPGRQLLEIAARADAERIPPGGPLVVATRDPATQRMGFERIDVRTGAHQPLYEDDIALGATDLAYNLAPMGDGRFVFVGETGDHPAEVWITDSSLVRARRLTNSNLRVASHALGRSRLVSWRGPGGEQLRGALLLPSDYEQGKRYPLIVSVYGGSYLSRTVNRFGLEAGIDNLQLLATRGYAVLLPDAPLREGSPLADLAATVLPGVDSVIAMGIADPDRVGVMGHSYGGYSTLALLVQTTRFRAAVSSGGFSNLLGQYTQMREDGSAIGVEWSEHEEGRMGASPWEARDRYIANSPLFSLDRVTTPVLLLHGGADRTVFAERAKETFVALRRLGKVATLVVYDGEDHYPGTWGLGNATDYWSRVFNWFNRYVNRVDRHPGP